MKDSILFYGVGDIHRISLKNISDEAEKMKKKSSQHFIKKKTKLAEKQSLIDNDITEISQRIMVELETASSKDLSEAKYAKKILQLSDLDYTKNLFREIESVPSGPERVIEKRAVIQALLLSTWLQRLYFIIRAALMSVLGGVVTFFYVSFFGQIGVFLAVVMGVLIFIIGLIVTRLFDTQIVKATKYIVRRLGHHKKIREFIMNHF
jgi:ABC-type multidrug transport system fused ATPase/permease subunit